MRTVIALQSRDRHLMLWEPTTLHDAGKDEKYLEDAISRTPELLCLEKRSSGIYGPFVVFNQLALGTPLGREIYPDITLLTASGDVVIVEVKLFANPEIRDRRVIAQIIDYVSSLSALDEQGMARLFSAGARADWTEMVRARFSGEHDPEELAAALHANAHDGNVHLVLACDKAPKGTYELARSVSAQSHLGFSLDVVELTPFVPRGGDADGILLVPNIRLSTEIVARTAVSVTYAPGAPQPGVSIETTSVEEIEENIAAVQIGERRSSGRNWTDQEIEDAILASDDPTVHALYRFAKEAGYGRIQSTSSKVSATFGYYMHVRRGDGSEGPQQLFYYVAGADKLVIFLDWKPETVPPEVLAEFKDDLKEILGPSLKSKASEANVPLVVIGDRLEEFKGVIRTLQRRIDPGDGMDA